MAALVVTLLGLGGHATAEVLPAQQQQVDKLEESLQNAASLFRAKKFNDLAKLVEEMEQTVEGLKSEANADLGPTLAAIELRLTAAQRLVKSAVDQAAAAADKKMADAKKAAPKAPPVKTPMKAKTMATGVSFVKEIAPLLASRCGNCHVNQARGDFSCASYASLRAGAAGLTVFTPGNQGGRLIEVLESGDMPRGGGPLSVDEIAMIGKWIKEGARFDGPDPTANIMSFGAGAMNDSMASAGNMATGMPTSGTISFINDVAPILVNRCVSCHSGDQGSANFELDKYPRMMGRGRAGAQVTPGNGSGSMLVKMLKGEAKDQTGKARQRMPPRGGPLSADQIKIIETWIAEGARFDGDDPALEIEFLVKQIAALKMSHEQLAASRAPLAEANWAKGSAGASPTRVDTDEYTIFSSLSPARMEEVVKLIADERVKLNNVLKTTSKEPIVKGKLSIFLVEKKFDLAEFARMVDERDIPTEMHGLFLNNTIDAHAILLAPRENDTNFPLLVAEQFCGAHFDALNKNLPKWFAAGCGRAFAAKVEPRAPLIKYWDEEARAAMMNGKPTFVTAKTLDGPTTALAYGLAKNLVNSGPKFKILTDDLKKGTRFDGAFRHAYGVSPQDFATVWMRSGG
jgi:cytochrome c553